MTMSPLGNYSSHALANLSVFFSYSASVPLINDDLYELLAVTAFTLILVFAILGVVTNAINIRVFIKQGLSSDSSTVSLFALAIADFLGCALEVPQPICQIIVFSGLTSVSFSYATVSHIVWHVPHLVASRMTAWITVYIALERCLCVLVPFKVKILISPQTTTGVMILIYALCVAIGLLYPSYTRMGLAFSDQHNATVLRITVSKSGRKVLLYVSLIFNLVLSPMAMFIVTMATVLMVYKLHTARKWRQKSQSKISHEEFDRNLKESSAGKSDLEVLKTVTMVTGLFLVCLCMNMIPGYVNAIIPESTNTGLNKNVFYMSHAIKVMFDVINSSLNYFFYIRISSRYKAAFNEVFRKASAS